MDDIEMGELAEESEEKAQSPPKKKVREELEEGEASDSDLGSELTDISDDQPALIITIFSYHVHESILLLYTCYEERRFLHVLR